MSDKENNKLESKIKEALEQQRQLGIRIGIQSVSKIILKKLEDTSKPIMKRIAEIKDFCKVSANNTDFLNVKGEPTDEECNK